MNKRQIGAILLCMISFICLTLAVIKFGMLHQWKANSLFQKEMEDFTLEEARQIEETEAKQESPISFAFWGEKKQTKAENSDLKRTANVKAVALFGSSSLVLGGGYNLNQEDTEGCLIDKHTAFTLFGSEDVVGKSILLEGRTLIIRAVIEKGEGVIAYQLKEGSLIPLKSLYLDIEEKNSYEAATAFLARHGLNCREVPLSYVTAMTRLIVYIMPLFLFAAIVTEVIRITWQRRDHPLYLIGGIFCIGIMIEIFLRVTPLQIKLPGDMIPTKWSDFSYWEGYIDVVRQRMTLLFTMEKDFPMSVYLSSCLAAAGFGWLSLVFIAFSMKRVKSQKVQ